MNIVLYIHQFQVYFESAKLRVSWACETTIQVEVALELDDFPRFIQVCVTLGQGAWIKQAQKGRIHFIKTND